MFSEKSDNDVKIEDKRRFDDEGNLKKETGASESVSEDAVRKRVASDEKREEGDSSDGEGKKKTEKGDAGSEFKLPEIDFSTFVLSLASSAQVHLGLVDNPATNKKEISFPLAKQTIDILGMIQSKTKGNLTDNESKLIEEILYQLRVLYMEKNK